MLFLPDPEHGRVFAASRIVRSTDVTMARRLRFDALARYLQEAAEDDLADSGWDEPYVWLLRRVAVAIRRYPGYGETLGLRTFCSAMGPRWAERTTTVTGSGGELIQASAVWVAVGRSDGRPAPLDATFHRLYDAAAQGRSVSARLSHPGPPEPPSSPGPPEPLGRSGVPESAGQAAGRAWPLRVSDFDTAGHVNNAIHWAAVEDILADRDWLPSSAELEYHRPILPGHDPQLITSHSRDQLCVWLVNGSRRLASARLAGAFPAAVS